MLWINCFYRISIKALIIDNNEKILLSREKNWKLDFLWWWLEFWENYKKCLIREIKEETWIDVIKIEKKPSYFLTFEKNWYHFANIFYLTKLKNFNIIKSKKQTEDKSIELKFFSKNEILNKKNISQSVKIFLDHF